MLRSGVVLVLASSVLAAATLALLLFSPNARAQGGAMTVESSAFTNGGAIPQQFSCDGRGQSPPLRVSNVPPGTKSLALVVEDPDAPKGKFVHWVVYGLPAAQVDLPAGASEQNGLPQGAMQGKNGKGQTGWVPVCPPNGMHHYHFKVYALRDALTLSQPSEDNLMHAMQGRTLASAEIVGTYQRAGK